MKGIEKNQRLALTILFSAVVFCFIIATMIVAGAVIIFLLHKGILKQANDGPRVDNNN